MQITVHYVGQARSAVGKAHESVALNAPCAVRDLLMQLAHQHGEPLQRLILNHNGNPHASILLFIGEDQVRPDDARELQPGDVVSILPPISGG